jgi:hypothetical protein
MSYALPNDRWKKASALLLSVQQGKIDKRKLDAFIDRLQKLLKEAPKADKRGSQPDSSADVREPRHHA